MGGHVSRAGNTCLCMGTPHEEYATLVADVIANLRAWREDGGFSVPGGTVAGLEPPPLEFAAPAFARPTQPVAPPLELRPPSYASVASPRTPAQVSAPAVRSPSSVAGGERPAVVVPAAPEPARPAAGLFGARWAAAVEDGADRLARVVGTLPAACADCGAAPSRGAGNPRTRLVVVASPLAGEAQAMLDRMLVHVLAMEATDVWTVAPVACTTCAALVRGQVEAVAPRAILALGPAAQALTGLSGRGVWGVWAGAEALATYHPDELLRAPDDKRHAFAHLKDVARRVT